MGFVNLHVHTKYSMLDGMGKINELVSRAKEMGQNALAITDHGRCHGWIHFYKECKKQDIKPIIGVEVYVSPDRLLKTSDNREGYHLVLLAKDQEGYKNLLKIISDSELVGFYYRPNTDITVLEKYGKGIIALSACLAGEIPKLLMSDKYEEAKKLALRYNEIFDEFYLELQANNTVDQLRCNHLLIELHKDTSIPLVVTNDTHYTFKEDAWAHEVLLAIQTSAVIEEEVLLSKGSFNVDNPETNPTDTCSDKHSSDFPDAMQDESDDDTNKKTKKKAKKKKERFKFDSPNYWLKSEEEVREFLPDYDGLLDEAIENTQRIADKCCVEFEFGENKLPHVEVPGGMTSHEYLSKKCYDALYDFCERTNYEIDCAKYYDRLEYELSILKKHDVSDYFLIDEDIIRYARDNGILTGPGRGCFAPETQIYLSSGVTKPIKDIAIGDKIINKNCQVDTVVNKFEYEVEEEMVKLTTMYGIDPMLLTKDHKVLAVKTEECTNPSMVKGKRPTSCTLNCSLYPCKRSNFSLEVGWVESGELKHGDYVVLPKPEASAVVPEQIDLLDYSENVLDFDEEKVTLKTTINQKCGFSVREMSKKYGISRETLNRVLQGETEKMRAETISKVKSLVQNEGFQSIEEWKRSYSEWLNKNMRLEVKRYLSVDGDFLKFLGMYIGNGWIRKYRFGIAFHSDAVEDIEFCKKFMEDNFSKSVSIRNGYKGKKVVQIMCNSGVATNLMNALVPKHAKNKAMPSWFTGLSKEQALNLLEGLIATDGSEGKDGRISYDSISIDLIMQIRYLLMRLGVPSSFSRREANPEKSRPNESYKLRFRFKDLLETDKLSNVKYYMEDENYIYVRVVNSERVGYSGKVYDLQVENDPSFTTANFIAHNSAAGSLVSYLLGITRIDPLGYNTNVELMFERFLSPERKELPDIDSDLEPERRKDVLRYLREKYGSKRVVQIATFGKMGAKTVIKDVGRALGKDFDTLNEITKLIPASIEDHETGDVMSNFTLSDLIEEKDVNGNYTPSALALQELRNNEPELFKIAERLEGIPRQTGIHAGGVVISPVDLDELIPMMRSTDDMSATQFDMDTIAELGLVKYDLLGLKTLSIIGNSFDLIKRYEGLDINPDELDLTDEKVYKLLSEGDTLGVFQVESDMFRNLLIQMKPSNFADITAALALGRPGPLDSGMDQVYIRNKHGYSRIEYPHEDLEEIMSDTHGIFLYQEQLMLTCMKLAGFSALEADSMRKAVGKCFIWYC